MAARNLDVYARPTAGPLSYRFSGFVVDAQAGHLSREGVRIPVQELPFQLLLALLERPGEPWTREDLRHRLWPEDVHLDFNDALATAVRKLRLALGDSAHDPQLIETLPGRGYRFMVMPDKDPEPAPAPAAVPARPFRGWLPALGLILVAGVLGLAWSKRMPSRKPAPAPRVVALPTRMAGDGPALPMADMVPFLFTTHLAGVPGLEARIPPSSEDLVRLQGGPERIARVYQVDYLVLSAATVEGGRLSLDVQLVAAGGGSVLCARRLEGRLAEAPRLADQAVRALLAELLPQAKPHRTDPPLAMGVELALTEGKYLLRRYLLAQRKADFDACQAAFEQALREDPGCALASAYLAHLRIFRSWYAPDRPAAKRHLRDAFILARHALERDAACGVAWAALAQVECAQDPPVDLEKALDLALRAACLSPGEPFAQMPLGGAVGGNILGSAVGRRMYEMDPFDLPGASMGAICFTWGGRPADGLKLIEEALPMGSPKARAHSTTRAQALIHLGRLAEARAALEGNGPTDRDLDWDDDVWRGVRFQLAIAEGDAGLARSLAKSMLARILGPGPRQPAEFGNDAYLLVPGLAALGMKEEALQLLMKFVEAGCLEGTTELLRKPGMERLAGDPRFAQVREAARRANRTTLAALDRAQARYGLPDYLKRAREDLRAEAERP